MFILLKIIIGFILTYLAIFGITVIITKIVDNWRINKDKIDYIPRGTLPKPTNEDIKTKSKPQNLRWNNTLGVWEE